MVINYHTSNFHARCALCNKLLAQVQAVELMICSSQNVCNYY